MAGTEQVRDKWRGREQSKDIMQGLLGGSEDFSLHSNGTGSCGRYWAEEKHILHRLPLAAVGRTAWGGGGRQRSQKVQNLGGGPGEQWC